jgi:hypothetical protein
MALARMFELAPRLNHATEHWADAERLFDASGVELGVHALSLLKVPRSRDGLAILRRYIPAPDADDAEDAEAWTLELTAPDRRRSRRCELT